jgi:RND superfamily putative drug exporter
MFTSIARITTIHPKRVLIVAFILVVVAAGLGGGVIDRLTTGGFADPKSEAIQARDTLATRYGQAESNLVVIVNAKSGSVDDPAVAAEAEALLTEIQTTEGIANAVSYWSTGNAPPLRGADGKQALILVSIAGDEDLVGERADLLIPTLQIDNDIISTQITGSAEIGRQFTSQIEADLKAGETLALPITLILLVIVFGSLIAAGLPIFIGIISVIGTLFALFAISLLTDVSVYALNLTTMLGLGLAIDYSLFIVSRYREELVKGFTPAVAVSRTVQTAGRTVAFSALTVAVSLGALLVFPQAFLRSFAYAGVAVSVIAALASVMILPAVLTLLGTRGNKLELIQKRQKAVEGGAWHRVAIFVMKRPVIVAGVVIALLIGLGLPFRNIQLGLGDDRALPADNVARIATDSLRNNFDSNESGALEVVSTTADTIETSAIDAYAAALSNVSGVGRVDALTGTYVNGSVVAEPTATSQRFTNEANEGAWFSVVPNIEPISPEGEDLVRDIRNVDASFETYVGGSAAQLVDLKASLTARLPFAIAWICLSTFVLLFLMFGSVLVPIKALIINALSLSATFGAMVWVFQEGNLSGILNFTATGSIEATMPILIFCVAFGLSMDYEVFLLSRIKEEYDVTGDNTTSVAHGLEKTGRIVSAAAVLISVVFISFGTSGVSFIKMFGLGLALAVLMDAFVIRGTLVPAFMRLAGDANWWAPAWMRKIHNRFGISEHVDLDALEPAPNLTHDGQTLEADHKAVSV